jgi:hypothetical protein
MSEHSNPFLEFPHDLEIHVEVRDDNTMVLVHTNLAGFKPGILVSVEPTQSKGRNLFLVTLKDQPSMCHLIQTVGRFQRYKMEL